MPTAKVNEVIFNGKFVTFLEDEVDPELMEEEDLPIGAEAGDEEGEEEREAQEEAEEEEVKYISETSA